MFEHQKTLFMLIYELTKSFVEISFLKHYQILNLAFSYFHNNEIHCVLHSENGKI